MSFLDRLPGAVNGAPGIFPFDSLSLTVHLSLADGPVAKLPGQGSPADLSEFLIRREAPSASALVQGFCKSQGGDVYEGSLSFFRSLSAPDPGFAAKLTFSGDRFSIHIQPREGPLKADAPEPVALLGLLEDSCAQSLAKGEKSIAPALEALGLAVARHSCINGKVEVAQQLIRRLLTISRNSIHLRSTEQAIGSLVKKEPVPAHLEKYVGADRNVLGTRFCPVPFARADVHQGGDVVMCCSHWLPTPIGNVFKENAGQILNSEIAKSIRRSVVDGSFKYCSHADCELIVNDKLPHQKDYVGKDFDDDYYHIDREILQKAFARESFEIPNVSYLIFCLDRSCNLTCPSCRTHLIMVKGEERDRLYDVTERSVLPMLRNAKRVMVNPSGEAFASKPSIQLLEALKQPGYEKVVVDIITNATVCDQEQWDKFSHLYGRLNIVRVSVDGASKEVIERLRRGAEYDILVSNLRNLSRMHKAGYFRNFFMSFTYQRDNVAEMEEFVKFARSFGVSTVIFERLQNVGAFTSEEYYDRAVHLTEHPLHPQFLDMVRKVKQDPVVYIDFAL